MVLGLMTFLGGIPWLEKDDDLYAKWTIYNTVEITWRGKRFGLCLNFKRTYDLWEIPLNERKEQIFNHFFEELNYHLKEAKERYYLERNQLPFTVLDHLNNYVASPERFKAADLATLNEILTKSGLHHLMNTPNIGGKYEDPWLFKDVDIDCAHTIIKHETAGSI